MRILHPDSAYFHPREGMLTLCLSISNSSVPAQFLQGINQARDKGCWPLVSLTINRGEEMSTLCLIISNSLVPVQFLQAIYQA